MATVAGGIVLDNAVLFTFGERAAAAFRLCFPCDLSRC